MQLPKPSVLSEVAEAIGAVQWSSKLVGSSATVVEPLSSRQTELLEVVEVRATVERWILVVLEDA